MKAGSVQKGRFGYGFIHSPDRLTKPLIRIAPKESRGIDIKSKPSEKLSFTPHRLTIHSLKRFPGTKLLIILQSRLKEIKEKYGSDSIGGLSSARCTNEENYLFQKFMRAAIGTNNVDHCARY